MSKDRNKTKPTPKSPQRGGGRPVERRPEGDRERAGSRTVERRKERERERRRRQLITGGIIAAALIIIAIVLVVVVNAPADAPIPSYALTRYEGLPQSRTTEGYPRLGDPNSPVQVAEYSSFDCTHCRDFHEQAMNQIVDRVRSGAIAFTFVPLYGFGSVANGLGAATAAVCAGEQGQFWPFHDALFDWQGQFINQAFTNNRLSAAVDAFQLDRAAYNACVGGTGVSEVLSTARTQATSLLNFTGTPTITINGVVPLGQDQQPISDASGVIARIDEEIARNPVQSATTEATAEATVSAASTAEATATAEATVEATAAAAATAEATAETTPAS